MSEQEDSQIKKAIAEFAQRIAKTFSEYPTFSIEEINEDPAETLLGSEDLAFVFENEANKMLNEVEPKKKEVPTSE